jgi:fatty-acyl-CoA synthase
LGVDALALSSRSTVLPVVPMYHANAWGIPYAAAAVGAKLVMGGPHFDPQTLHRLTVEEGVTISAGVPTVWFGLLNYLEKNGLGLGKLERTIIGGSAAPRSMIEIFEQRYGVTVVHAWGMTEMSPVGTAGALCAWAAEQSPEEQIEIKSRQGRPVFGVELTIQDDEGRTLPRDGQTMGHLKTRGAWIVERYFAEDGPPILDQDGWFDTGDIAAIDAHGYVRITDRAKDVIKSGGEWISTIALENLAVGHPAVAEAAVIGVPHPKWDERPILILVGKNGERVSREEMLEYLSGKVAKWWLPDDVVLVDSLPHTATGKLQKTALREQFKDYGKPTSQA